MSQMYKRPAPPRTAQTNRQTTYNRLSRTSARAVHSRSTRKGEVAILAIGGLIVAALAFALQSAWPNGFPLVKSQAQSAAVPVVAVTEIHASGPLRINEIMTSNHRTLVAEDGSTPDWIEVANVGSRAVGLAGYTLAKTDSGAGAFTFPDLTLEPGECALVSADSRLRAEVSEALHAPFRLSSAGDTLMLFNPSGAAIDTVNIPELGADHSYVRTGEAQWEIGSMPTPGLLNSQENYLMLTEPSGDSPVIVSEIVASNRNALADESGEYCDYIELYNRSGEAVSLMGWYLSDDAQQPRKWSFPTLDLQPGEYLVVYASGYNRRDDPAHLHTNFSLRSEGEQVVLSNNQGQMMDCVDFGLLKADTAWSLGTDGSWRSASPTPGRANQ